ncbi:GntR family transcriptional regulator [Priestia megaterium]|uniref:GntR family transcriptional regulator n=1 Tax=Priestia megaterium TaxID=1404 RepID=UPI0025AF0434|nr:GntR family transcriptional regulator [Priestia megaterium]MDN3233133.1 GntR family transcriptional regulator [Priestia megaterium]
MKTPKIVTIKEQVYEIIKNRILTQEYQFGEKINIGSLSKELGISNSPIREALSQLGQEGLVVSTPNSGLRVVNMSKRDLFEQAQMVYFWMIGSYRYCAENDKTEQLVRDLEECLKKQKKYYEEKNHYKFIYYSDYFDRCILATTENSRLLKQFDAIFPLFLLASGSYLQGSEKEWHLSIQEHEKILLAIKEKKHDEVQEAIKVHYFKPSWTLDI